jgi:hypothetical protein
MYAYRSFLISVVAATLLGGCGYADLSGTPASQPDSEEATALAAPAPRVVTLEPANGALDVPADSAFTVTFDGPVEANANGIRVTVDGTAVNTSVQVSGATVTLTPAGPLPYSSDVSIWIDPGAVTGPQDAAFEGLLVASDWRVTTEPNPDTTAPTVNWDHPQAIPSSASFVLKTDIPSAMPRSTEPIPLIFTEPVVVLDETRIVLEAEAGKGFAQIPATVTMDADDRVTIEPAGGAFSDQDGVIYRVSVRSGAVADEAGNGLAPDERYFRFYVVILRPPSV